MIGTVVVIGISVSIISPMISVVKAIERVVVISPSPSKMSVIPIIEEGIIKRVVIKIIKIPRIGISPVRKIGTRIVIKIDIHFGWIVPPSSMAIVIINFVLI